MRLNSDKAHDRATGIAGRPLERRYKDGFRASAHASKLATLDTCQRAQRGTGILRSLSARVIAPIENVPSVLRAFNTCHSLRACSSAAPIAVVRPISPAIRILLGLASCAPVAFLTARAVFVRSEIG